MTSLDELRAAFHGRMHTSEAEMASFLTDWRRLWHGAARAVVQPDTTDDVAAVVRWCHAHRVPVVAQGGNTGLSGGAIPDSSGNAIVLSLARLKRIRGIDPINNTLTVEAGCILQQVQNAAREAGRLFPLSLAAEGSCTIGGNLATNAGGTAVLRYGNARELCLGLEVVTAEGRIWNGLRGLRKDNTGLDLRDLFVGSEGTLGIITAAVLKLFPLPAARAVAMVAVASPQQALRLLETAQARFDGALTAFELVSRASLELVLQYFPRSRDPFPAASPWYVLIEASDLMSEQAVMEKLQALLEHAVERDVITDAVLATTLSQAQELWALRENISEAQSHAGASIKHDISVPISQIAGFIEHGSAALEAVFPRTRLIVFGHLGDGNLHFNVSAQTSIDDASLLAHQPAINRIVHDLVAACDGSISAEHGLGVLRRDEARRYKSALELQLMRSIKRALDPTGILNPGKMLPSDS